MAHRRTPKWSTSLDSTICTIYLVNNQFWHIMTFMSELEAPKPSYPFNVDAVEQHGHAVINLSMQVSEQNAGFNIVLPQFEDPEIRDILHHELYSDQ
jgi:hypothetical protein